MKELKQENQRLLGRRLEGKEIEEDVQDVLQLMEKAKVAASRSPFEKHQLGLPDGSVRIQEE